MPWGYAEKDPGACPFGGLEGGSFPKSSFKNETVHLEPSENSGIKRVYDGGQELWGQRMTFQKPPQDSVPSFFSHSGFLFPTETVVLPTLWSHGFFPR